MKGVTVGRPGEVIWLDYPDPALGPGEALLGPLACGICTTDVKLVKAGSDGKNHYALGHELVGRIVAVEGPSRWAVGQRVVAAPYVNCGACYYCQHNQPTLCTHLFENSLNPGGLAQQVRLPRGLAERGLMAVPDQVSDEAAALSEPVGCAVKGVEDSGVQPGDAVLIVGDGPMGLICAAVARAYGAAPLIVAGLTPHRLTAATRIAEAVIDVSQQDLRTAAQALTGGRGADVVMAVVSEGQPLEAAMAAVRPGGTVNAFAGVPKGTTIPLDVRRLHYEQIHLTGSFGVGPEHLARALHLLATGRVDASLLISARFPFAQTPAAVAYAADRVGLKAMVIFDGQPVEEQ
ncbi:MAG: zinc-binding dehydrogenase [Anaerolineales bacterium]|nr:zinc-binding dehydrogenase [Anaerolineales bacterium]